MGRKKGTGVRERGGGERVLQGQEGGHLVAVGKKSFSKNREREGEKGIVWQLGEGRLSIEGGGGGELMAGKGGGVPGKGSVVGEMA